MRMVVRVAVSIIGALMALTLAPARSAGVGVFWILQGTGVVPVGLMANHIQYAYFGVVWIAVAAGLIWFVNRPKGKSAGS